MGMASYHDELSFNITEAVLAAINTTNQHPAGYKTLLARFEGNVNTNPRDTVLPLNFTACGEHNYFSGVNWNNGAGGVTSP